MELVLLLISKARKEPGDDGTAAAIVSQLCSVLLLFSSNPTISGIPAAPVKAAVLCLIAGCRMLTSHSD